MLNKLNKNRGGFTLVEIMIVVAIIALLASVAVPSFLRARKRSQATAVKNDLRLIDAAVDQYAIENNKAAGVQPTGADISKYLKTGTRLQVAAANNAITDQLGNTVAVPTVDALPKLPTTTNTALSDVADANFWAPYSIN
ncbi:MAG: prepilin-type N-terminal cleavage/methylation domain-containing protein [Chthoniobacterales bacterium]